eukprot:jgi/Undpi1/9843/HiC_scaffold_28.g12297.m1
MTSYMSGETPLWTRIHCFLAASEASGYDVSPCVAAIVDTGTLPCVDDVYEAPTVDQLECEANGIKESSASSSWEECIWDGDPRTAQEMFPFTSPSSLATVASAVVNTNSCLVGCLVRGISPFDDDGLAVWDNRGGSTLPLDVEGGVSCSVGSTCQAGYCCHPDTSMCGRKYTFCQQRNFSDGPRCCSGVDGDPSASNVCSEDTVCVKPGARTLAEVIAMWFRILGGPILIGGFICGGYNCYRKKRKDGRPK